MKNFYLIGSLVLALVGQARFVQAGAGTDGANFLNIPVGGGPAALGGAYTALAADAYAPIWNPAGLGYLESMQFAGQHLAYLGSSHYEQASFVLPFERAQGSGIGGSVQYLGSGNMTGRNLSGDPTGDFSSYYAAYNLSYGRALNDWLSLGLTSKFIQARIEEVSASAFAVDAGSMYRLRKDLTFAATLTNLGTKLTFIDEGDSLPLAFRVGALYQPSHRWRATGETSFRKTGLFSWHMGGEWNPVQSLSLRIGYRTDTTRELSALAGFSTGVGLHAWGYELSYAWLPYGDLGNTHYLSFVAKFGEAERKKQNLIQGQNIKHHSTGMEAEDISESLQLIELLQEGDKFGSVQRPTERRNP